ncbi:MAG: hypothetical protein C0505_12990 [Leptothrix sp. (in: Bacteria)]|nr:hypothetical protein [Leptothrix sp. (in: b-proteobacteria)]
MPDADSDFSVLLWALGAFVAALALHLGQGWTRMAARSTSLRHGWRALLLASAVLGLGLTSALELGMQAQPFAFPVGYRWLAVAVLVPVALVACLPAVWVAAAGAGKAYGNTMLLAAGALLAVAALGLQGGWVWAAGFRPGVLWRVELVAAAAVLLVIGLALAQWMALAPSIQASARRALWRAAAAALGALVLMAGQQVMSIAAGLQVQTVSNFSGEIPGTVLSLVCGVLVPLALVALMLDLWLRRHQRRRHSHGDFNPKPRRKRRHKVRAL